jgi:hypothetical protein
MNDDGLRALLADLAKQQAEERAKTEVSQRLTEQTLRRIAAQQAAEHAKTEQTLREVTKQLGLQAEGHAKTEGTVRQVTKQLGGLGNKFGSFTEGLAFESVEKILRTKFHADDLARRVKVIRGERAQEYDLIGVRNGVQSEVYCVEIKSELNADELQKSVKKFGEFFNLLPRYRGMKLYGIICAVDVRGALADLVMREGLYLATAGDENFKLVKPSPGFQPRVFTAE